MAKLTQTENLNIYHPLDILPTFAFLSGPSMTLPWKWWPSQTHIYDFWHVLYVPTFNLAIVGCLCFPQYWEAPESSASVFPSPVPSSLLTQWLAHTRCSAHVCWIEFFMLPKTTCFHSCFQKQLACCLVFPSRRLMSRELKLRTVTDVMLPKTMAGTE